jgi:hypothetical protein
MTIKIKGQWMHGKPAIWVEQRGYRTTQSPEQGRPCFYTALSEAQQTFGDGEFGGILHSFAVAVPSVVAPAWNIVLFPGAHGFSESVTAESIEPFEFDPRLFPENTPVESPSV